MVRKLIFVIVLMTTLGISAAFAQNSAIYFDGLNDAVAIPNPGPTNQITFECWFKMDTLGSGDLGKTIVSSNISTEKSLWLTSVGSELRLWAFGSSINTLRFTTSGANITVGTWYHVAIVAQRGAANRTILYLNGVEMINQPSYDYNYFQATIFLGNLRLNAGAQYAMHGLIDEVRIWTTLRTQSEILGAMNSILPTNTPGLVGYYPLDNNMNDYTTPAQDGVFYDGLVVGQPTYVLSDVTLPVELSSFMATGTSDFFVRLSWITQSEQDVMGFYVYRNNNQDYASATRISELIPANNQSSTMQYIFVDDEVSEGLWYYWLQNVDYNGEDTVHGPVSYHVVYNNGQNPGIPEIPITIGIEKIFPNPFNPSTTISYLLENDAAVNVTVYNLKGQIVRQLLNESRIAGSHRLQWNGMDDNGMLCSSGVYTVKVQIGSKVYSRNIVMSK